MTRPQMWLRFVNVLLLVFLCLSHAKVENCQAQDAEALSRIDFAKHVLPILDAKCVSCHGAEKHESGLRLDSKDAAFRGGDNGPAIVAKDADGSLLLQVLTGEHASIERMPSARSRSTRCGA